MKIGYVVPAVMLVVGVAGGCSSGSVSTPKSGTLPPGTAQFTVADGDAETTTAVQCLAVDSHTTINAGDDNRGVTAMVSNAGPLTVEFVKIRKLNGFTGGYHLGLEGKAKVAVTGSTYYIEGDAFGYSAASVEPTTQPFTMRVSC